MQKLKRDFYVSPDGEQMDILSEWGYTDDELDYLINSNPYSETFTSWTHFVPEPQVPFFCHHLQISSGNHGGEWRFNLCPSLSRITIIDDGSNKRYRSETMYLIGQDGVHDGYTVFDDRYQIGQPMICPDEQTTCSCGHYNNNPITAFPWDERPDLYIIAPNLHLLGQKFDIVTKELNYFTMRDHIQQGLIERRRKIEEVVLRNPGKFTSPKNNDAS